MVRKRHLECVGTSPERAGLFTLIATGLFIAGFLLPEVPMVLGLGIALLVLTAILTALQAYFNGSVALALVLSVTAPLGFVVESMLPAWRPFLFTMLHLGLSLGLLFGGTGHLIGSQVATIRDGPVDPSYWGQIGISALMFVIIGSYVLSSGSI